MIGVYVFLVLLVILLLPGTSVSVSWAPDLIIAILIFLLVRYVCTTYSITDTQLRTWRIVGNRRIELEEIRQIEYSSMRDLGPTSFFGSWGWRGRMWSPRIGHFDAVYTDPAQGILVTAGEVPIYISPKDPEGFARELSRRVRSYTGRLAVDVGDPSGSAGPSKF